MFGQDRTQLRKMFFSAWHKSRQQQLLEPLEAIIVKVIELHPEYHTLLSDEANLDRDYTPEMGQTNPFLHMAMHISIQEQLMTNRPAGIQSCYQALLTRYQDPHQVEHQMMECLGQILWQAQLNQTTPDEPAYLECLRKQC